MNKVILIGNLTKDPELTTTPSGVSLCKFSIAVNRQFVREGGERDVDFFNIVCWRSLADNCGKYLQKGKKAGVCGSIQTRTYDDKDGIKRYITEIVADDVEFLSPRGEGEPMGQPARSVVSELKPVESEDLPF